jgi:hypothetical protein
MTLESYLSSNSFATATVLYLYDSDHRIRIGKECHTLSAVVLYTWLHPYNSQQLLGKRGSACIFHTGRRKTQRKEMEVARTAVLTGGANFNGDKKCR